MQPMLKVWLVRTKSGEILGPYSEHELIDELENKTFSDSDEIAMSCGYWQSAEILLQRDIEEFTKTSTRNQTATHPLTPENDYETPTPSVTPTAPELQHEPSPPSPKKGSENSQPSHRFVPLVTASVIGVFLFIAISLHQNKKGTETFSEPNPNPTHNKLEPEGDSPFTKQIYTMIKSGEQQKALQMLTKYHEKHETGDSLEYLIPFSALLITESDSPNRAKKLLEQITNSNSGPQLKSKAHHWLGFLLLNQEEGDMGENHFLEALQLNPKDPAARFNLGRCYLKQQKYSQALDYLQLAELEAPDLWLVHIYKGRAKTALGNTEEARQSFKSAIQSGKDRWMSYIYYSLFLMGIRENEEARGVLRSMLTKDPHFEIQSPPPFGFYQEKVDYAEYLNAFSHVMEKAPAEDKETGKAYLNFLQSGINGNDLKKLHQLVEKGNLTAKVILLRMILEEGTHKELIKNLIALLPQNLTEFGYYGYLTRSEAHMTLEQWKEANEDIQRALMLEPKSALAHWTYAVLLKKTQKKDEAFEELKTVLTFNPNYIPAIISSHNF